MKKRISSFVLALLMVISILYPGLSIKTDAAGLPHINDSAVFLKQESSNTCTVAAATMMLRRRAILDKNENWTAITESSVKSVAWGSSGLSYTFTYSGMTVDTLGLISNGYDTVAKKKAYFISLLEKNPEGIVIYDHSRPHAVLLTDYDKANDVFYCADSALGTGRILLTRSTLTGSTETQKIENVKQIWRITKNTNAKFISNTDIEKAIAWGEGFLSPTDSSKFSGLCAAFVYHAYHEGAGIANSSYSTATVMGDALITHTDSNPPRGALVFWYIPNEPAGHVALSLGGGKIIHAWGYKPNCVVAGTVANVTNYYGASNYRGWGAPIAGYTLATESGPGSGTKPSLSSSISASDYLTYYATVTSLSCSATPKNGDSIQAWKLPWTDTKNGVQNAKLKLTTVSGTFKIKNKVVNHSGNVWYEYETGTGTRGFVYGNEITLLPYAVGADVTNKGADTAKLVVTWKNPGGIKLVKGGFILKNSSGNTLKTVTENVPQSYQTALDLPCSYEMKTEYKYPLQPNTTYTYTMFVIDSNNKQYEVTGKFTTNAIPVTGVSVSPASSSVQVGKTVQLTASIAPSNASDKGVIWKSSNTAVATVSSSGVVTAKGIGTATITATATDGSGKSGSATITVTCNHSSTVTLPAVAPTCTATGLTEGKKCSTCGAVMVAQTEVAPLDHSYSYKATKAPTTSEAGTLTGTCSKCSGTTTVTLPKLNTTDYTYNVTKEPSYTAAGTGRYTWKTNTYGTYYFDVTLDKMTATLTGIEVAVKPAKTVYEIGESLDTTGLALKATYSDGSTKNITSGFEMSGFDSSATGEKIVTVTYDGMDASFIVTVISAATDSDPQIVVSRKTGITGQQVEVAVSLKNNPGFASMQLTIGYDADVLTLVGVTDSGNLGTAVHSDNLNACPYTLSWVNDLATTDYTHNGDAVMLTFLVAENARFGESAITVSYDYDNFEIYNVDGEKVWFATVNGYVNVTDVLLGDVNSDGRVNAQDRLLLTRYLAKWTGYTEDMINMSAADINCDGKVNAQDRLILTRHLAKWTGYENLGN